MRSIEELHFAFDVMSRYPKGLKVQLRPKFDNFEKLEGIIFIVKWGGELTPYGRKTAQKFGNYFRDFALRSTDEKQKAHFLSVMRAYASDEARVRR